MKIITFCSHVPYLYLFASFGWQVDVVQLTGNRPFLQRWNNKIRPLPEGWRLIDWQEGQRLLRAKHYKLALAHNINDYVDLIRYPIPRILIVHFSLSGRIYEEKSRIDKASYLQQIAELLSKSGGRLVYISEAKQQDWGLPGEVIRHGIPGDDYGGYHGSEARILRVSNNLVERGALLDYAAHQRLTRDLPLSLIGQNPKTPGAQPASSWDELKSAYQKHRVYLHTAKPGLEDGFNLGMLEAMLTGMPVLSTAHPTSPLVDGENGFISADMDYLRERMEAMLANRELALRLGRNARETVLQQFGAEPFRQQWEALVASV